MVRAKRIMRKLDKDGNGTFEKKENAAAWRRYRKLDTNHDQILTIEELRKERPAYLETGGERKLNIAYKETPKGKLLLDLYYRHGERQKGKLPIPGYCLHPRWRLGSGQ